MMNSANSKDKAAGEATNPLDATPATAIPKAEIDAIATANHSDPSTWPGATAFTVETAATMSAADFTACFNLIASTSAAAYRASSKGWSPRAKKDEMRDPLMRYILVRSPRAGVDAAGKEQHVPIAAFLSYQITDEGDTRVVYIYEVHVVAAARAVGIGTWLMRAAEAAGRATEGVQAAMLTVFTSNAAARAFYVKRGYEVVDEEPLAPARKWLRNRMVGAVRAPTYVIMAKELR